jgi:CXXX repeat modification system protein
MERKEIGKVSLEERDTARLLFERRNGLAELRKSLPDMSKQEPGSSPLYEKITEDLGLVSIEFRKWWDTMSRKYQWENLPGYKWEIDFKNCTVFIIKQG